MRTEQFLHDLKHDREEAIKTIFSMIFGAVLLMVIGYYVPLIYYRYFDTKSYYDITNPITVEKKDNVRCTFIDAYINRKVLAPIVGTSVKQLALVRDDNGMKERMKSYTTNIQADVGEGTMIAHWELPCDVPEGTYFFEGTVQYFVRGIPKYTHFFTENFNIVATPSADLN